MPMSKSNIGSIKDSILAGISHGILELRRKRGVQSSPSPRDLRSWPEPPEFLFSAALPTRINYA